MKSLRLKISGMHCSACAMDIDGNLEDNGVEESRTSYAKGVTEVSFDPKIITQGKIIKLIKDIGYDAIQV